MSEQKIQAEQRTRYENWVKAEGGVERAVLDSTYREPAQVERTKWLVENTRDVPSFLFSRFKSILEVGCS